MKLTKLNASVIALALLILPNVAKSQDAVKPSDDTKVEPSRRRVRSLDDGSTSSSGAEKPPLPTTKTVAIADLKDLRLDSRGFIKFTIENIKYRYFSADDPQRVLTAAALMDQMRKAKQVVIESNLVTKQQLALGFEEGEQIITLLTFVFDPAK